MSNCFRTTSSANKFVGISRTPTLDEQLHANFMAKNRLKQLSKVNSQTRLFRNDPLVASYIKSALMRTQYAGIRTVAITPTSQALQRMKTRDEELADKYLVILSDDESDEGSDDSDSKTAVDDPALKCQWCSLQLSTNKNLRFHLKQRLAKGQCPPLRKSKRRFSLVE